ncbi:helix-turn-helix domain-containing protein [Janthinobacterium lividum]|nr:helix-turn-helix domain-containing protein [Janthinobacterium lividum]
MSQFHLSYRQEIGVINVALLGIIRRWHLRDQIPIREIARRLDISRNTVRRYLRSEITEPSYAEWRSVSGLDKYSVQLSGWLKAETTKPRKQRRNLKQIYEDLKEQRYAGSYDRVAAFYRQWKAGQAEWGNSASNRTSPDGMRWLTSDDPVVKLSYNSPKSYDFLGGWGSVGTEIYMPLGPRHLLYTRIGHRPPNRGTVLSLELANCFQRFTPENAHRFVFSTDQDDRLPELRRHHVSAKAFESEAKQWKN